MKGLDINGLHQQACAVLCALAASTNSGQLPITRSLQTGTGWRLPLTRRLRAVLGRPVRSSRTPVTTSILRASRYAFLYDEELCGDAYLYAGCLTSTLLYAVLDKGAEGCHRMTMGVATAVYTAQIAGYWDVLAWRNRGGRCLSIP
jgi:hypothetical protein